ncbi:nucleotidyltransferase domain-containing protein [Clostridium botulinum]|nr:nucleotidyltransferase domain-containing protein [Clostridium botulinum]
MNLDKNILEEIINISKKYDYINKVVLFGSRVREDNSLKSDIDLAIYSDKDLGEYIEDIELNTRTLLEFDFSDMKNIKDEFFKEQINKDGVTIYEKHRF